MRIQFKTIRIGCAVALLGIAGFGVSCVATKSNRPQPISGPFGFSPEEQAQIKDYQVRNRELDALLAKRPEDWAAFESGVRAKLADFPKLAARDDIFGCAYGDFERLIWHYQLPNPAKAAALAQEVATSSAADHFRLRAAGFVWRSNATGKPVQFYFKAWDGQEVDSRALLRKVVLIDFWESSCPGCVAEAPQIRALYDRFHAGGLEIIGSCGDLEEKEMVRFIKKNKIMWPTDFANNPAVSNKLEYQFGIYGYPNLVLLDKQGRVRDLNAGYDADSPQQLEQSLAPKISKMLAE